MFADWEYEAVSRGVPGTVIHFYYVTVAHLGRYDTAVGDFWNNHLAIGKNIDWFKVAQNSFLFLFFFEA